MPDTPSSSLNPPKQTRSRRTRERIVEASLELLATEGPSGLTVPRSSTRSSPRWARSTRRFKGKNDLLDYLGERGVAGRARAMERRAGVTRLVGARARRAVRGRGGLLIDAQRSRSAYLKALDWAAGPPSDAYDTFRGELLEGLGRILLERSADFEHADPFDTLGASRTPCRPQSLLRKLKEVVGELSPRSYRVCHTPSSAPQPVRDARGGNPRRGPRYRRCPPTHLTRSSR